MSDALVRSSRVHPFLFICHPYHPYHPITCSPAHPFTSSLPTLPLLHLTTRIHAPIEVVFDLSRSVRLHLESMAHTGERMIEGPKGELFQLGDTVTWEARHLGRRRRLTVEITQMQPYRSFTDRMVRGDFKRMVHEHRFRSDGDATVMEDIFDYTSPLGWLGRLVDALFLRRYMHSLLAERNAAIRRKAEAVADSA